MATVLPAFLEFARGSVLVAHNAGFDISFLRASAAATGHAWPPFRVLDTVHLARQVVTRDEARNHKLATLAQLFRSPVTPGPPGADRRAGHGPCPARAARAGRLPRGHLGRGAGQLHLAGHSSATAQALSGRRSAERVRASTSSATPGAAPLYVGTSRDVRSRVRTYFTASEHRTRMAEMVGIAERVDAVPCATTLEAEVRELRLIAEHKPRYNRRSRFPERSTWVKLTVEPFPRLSIVRKVTDDGAAYLGPFGSKRLAEQAVLALHEAVPLRQCTQPAVPARRRHRLRPGRDGPLRRAVHRRAGMDDYAAVVQQARAAMTGDARSVVATLRSRIGRLAASERFEDAAIARDRMLTLLRAAARSQRLTPLAAAAEIVAARRWPAGGWELVLVRHGRLAGTCVSPPGADPMPYVAALRDTGEVVAPPVGPAPAASPEETEKILHWLERDGVRLVEPVRRVELPGPRRRRAALGARRTGGPGRRRSRRSTSRGTCVRCTSRRAPSRPATRRSARARLARVITAIVLIQAEVDRIPEVAEALAELDGVERGLLRHR